MAQGQAPLHPMGRPQAAPQAMDLLQMALAPVTARQPTLHAQLRREAAHTPAPPCTQTLPEAQATLEHLQQAMPLRSADVLRLMASANT